MQERGSTNVVVLPQLFTKPATEDITGSEFYCFMSDCWWVFAIEYQSQVVNQGLSQDPSYLSFGQVVFLKPPVWTGKIFYDDSSILTLGV